MAEDGVTGWATIYALRRALQVELGVAPLSSGFGPATTAAFTSVLGSIGEWTTNPAVLQILSGALWCKGYPGLWSGAEVTFSTLEPSIRAVRVDLGMSASLTYVDVKLMTSLLSMDADVQVRAGEWRVREVQQCLNLWYGQRRDFPIVPTEGVYSRQVQTALLFALQYELGMADGVANGNFGPGTRQGLQQRGAVGPDSVGRERLIYLFQGALRFNAYSAPFGGVFDPDTADLTREFQRFMALSASGVGDYATWCALLVSCGDTNRPTTGFDTAYQLTAAEAQGARRAGYTCVGRYTVGVGKFITSAELDALRDAGLRLFPIHQRFNNSVDVMTEATGRQHAVEALERCRTLGLPDGTTVYFPVDFDPVGESISGPVCSYFRGLRDAMGEAITTSYRIGVYGTRNVCRVVVDEGLAEGVFVAGMSTGYSGNMGFRMPEDWQLNQITELSVRLGTTERTISIDKDVVSPSAATVDLTHVVAPPTERDGSPSATGYDAFFEWLVRAEVACERGLSAASSLLSDLKPYHRLVPDYVSHWLQRPKYWGDNEGGTWPIYTAVLDNSESERLARAAAEEALADLSPAKPESARDTAHFAATLRGYLTWGVPDQADRCGLGDLGGWALDLIQVWGSFLRQSETDPGLDLGAYLRSQLGRVDGAGGFGWADLVADADAYATAVALRDHGGQLSEGMRSLLRGPDVDRVRSFYSRRFDDQPANVLTAFAQLVDGIDAGPVDNVIYSQDLLKRAAHATRLPVGYEVTTCALTFAELLADPAPR